MDLLPSGEQFVIRSGGTSATVVQVSGGLRLLEVDGRELLDGYPDDAVCDGARGQALLPWPNRIRDGRYSWLGADHQLALTEPTNSCAIHGLTRWANWQRADHDASSVLLTYRLPPQPGWDWILDLSLRYTVDSAGVTVRMTARNRSGTPCPFGAGAHPYIRCGPGLIDGGTLHIPAGTWLPTDLQQIPTGQNPVDGSAYDFRSPRRLDSTEIDYAYGDLSREDDGIFRARLAGEWTTEIWLDRAFPYLEVFTGDALPDPGRRRRGLGVEPMTGPPNAFATGTDVVSLAPEESWSGEWGIRLVS